MPKAWQVRRLYGKNEQMEWIYLSPHLDDAALSCGGLIWEQARSGERVSVWTICAGDPPARELSPFALSLHERWGTFSGSMAARRAEDIASCAVLGADVDHFSVPDCIYRTSPDGSIFLYDSEESLTGPVHPADQPLVDKLGDELRHKLPYSSSVVCPLAVGDHVDHHLVRNAVEGLGRELYYYVDFPYVLETDRAIDELLGDGWRYILHPVSASGLSAWQRAVALHSSQISTFWRGETEMRSELQAYCDRSGGVALWFKA